MVQRRPLVLINGTFQELPTGDTLFGAGSVQNNFTATASPAAVNDNTEGYEIGSVWINTITDIAYICLDASAGTAVWTEITATANGGNISVINDLSDVDTATIAPVNNQALVWNGTKWIPKTILMRQSEITITSYSTTASDFDGNVILRMNSISPVTVTVEPNMSPGEPVTFIQTGNGNVTFTPGTGVTIHSLNNNLTIAGKYGSATLIPDTNTAETYYLVGALV